MKSYEKIREEIEERKVKYEGTKCVKPIKTVPFLNRVEHLKKKHPGIGSLNSLGIRRR